MKTKLKLLISASLLLISAHVRAYDFEVDLGVSNYSHDDGLWVQEGLPNKRHMNAPSIGFKITDNIYKNNLFGLDYFLGWDYLGQIRMQSWAVADDNYDKSTKSCIGKCGHKSNFIGKGHDQGFSFGLSPKYQIGDVTVGVSAGFYYHLNTFSEHIEDFLQVGRIHDISTTQRWLIGQVYGVYAERNSWVIRLQYYKNPNHFFGSDVNVENFPAPWHSTINLSIGYKF